MPKFSVVIAVYNKEAYVANTLQAVLNQTEQDFEVVIVNDGSTDGSRAVVESFTDARIRFFNQENQGAGAARNFVIDKAVGTFIALLDADDYWLPNHLSTVGAMIEAFPSERLFATNSQFRIHGTLFRKNYAVDIASDTPQKLNFFDASMLDSIINSSSAVVHHSVFSSVGTYDTTIKSGQDTDLFIRMGLQHDIIFNPQVTVHIIRNDQSLSHTASNITDKANFKKFEPLESTHPKLKKYLDQNRYSLCILAKRTGNTKAFEENLKKMEVANLNAKQRLILKLPGSMIRLLLKVKALAARLGWRPIIRK